ncbi:MAG: calcium/sodium antiporter [Candidatus Uhrbacteria bacterium]
MIILFWIAVFIVALAVMVKGADWLLGSAEKIGLAAGLSPFIVGVTIVGLGTSLPELVSSLVAVFKDANEMVAANAIGSNVANILLVVGAATLIGRGAVLSKSLIDLDLPLLAISTVIFLGVAWDRAITFPEVLILLFTYGIYLLYTFVHEHDEPHSPESVALSTPLARVKRKRTTRTSVRPKITTKDFVMLGVGIIALVIGAKYVVDAVIALADIFDIATGVIAISAVALGTSLPELLVSVKAALRGQPEVALGNIFGSNVFNALVVVGIPGLFGTLALDDATYFIGLPALALVTLLFVISGISRRIHVWEGALYLVAYILFTAKLFSIF